MKQRITWNKLLSISANTPEDIVWQMLKNRTRRTSIQNYTLLLHRQVNTSTLYYCMRNKKFSTIIQTNFDASLICKDRNGWTLYCIMLSTFISKNRLFKYNIGSGHHKCVKMWIAMDGWRLRALLETLSSNISSQALNTYSYFILRKHFTSLRA
jgi:hypothetical protein